MEHAAIVRAGKTMLTVEVDAEIASAAMALQVDTAAIVARALADAVKTESDRVWREENRTWAEDYNRWIDRNGLPLERYRLF